jgi:O-antigen ligase
MAMTAAAEVAGMRNPGALWLKARATTLLDWLVAFWIFCGGFVITEPSPYELSFLLVLAVALYAGFGLHRSTLGLLVLFIAFTPFALIGAFQVRYNDLTDSLIFQAVTIFLLFTGYFVANYVADDPQRKMRIIMGAYIATGVLSGAIGTLGYLGILPGGTELFTRFGRAKAFFNDPNVYGPFLILPAMFLLQRVLLGNMRRALFAAALFMVILVGVFASFSRAAWGHFAASSLIVFLLIFFFEAHAKEKVRMIVLSMAGVLFIGIAIAGMLSIPAVSRLFETRATSQNYDEGETGRFGRQGYAFEMALNHPLGIGPNEFNNMRVQELPHNVYVNVLLVYGWGGGFIFYVLVLTTIWRGLSFVIRPGPNRLLLIPLVAVFIPLSVEAAIIDLDHWRHFFLVSGLIWGVTAAYDRASKPQRERHAALI